MYTVVLFNVSQCFLLLPVAYRIVCNIEVCLLVTNVIINDGVILYSIW